MEGVTPQALHRKNAVFDSVQVEDVLQEELERLKARSGVGRDLKVVWRPRARSGLSGEVKGGTVYVYERDEGEAVKVLRHEFIDYVVSQAIEPYRSVANRLVQLVNEMCYKRKEEVVEALLRLL